MIEKVKKVLSEVFDIDPQAINENSSKDDFEEWDSMKQLELITSLEKEFNVKFSMDEIITIDSVSKILAAINKRKC